jgi:ribose transport system ATP-binding protein
MQDSIAFQLSLREISKKYGPTRALDGLDLEMRSGECLAIVGENGAGKSTLLKIISGQVRPDSGQMQLDDVEYRPRNPRSAMQSGVAIVHQELCLAPHLSVEANILLGREHSRSGWINRKTSKDRCRAILGELDHSQLKLDTPVGQLTPGLRQIVEIARALASDARILLLDEPTSSLSEADTRKLFVAIERLKSRGLAIVFISHALEEVQQVADRIAVIRDGQLVRVAEKKDWDTNSIIAAMVGRSIEDLYPQRNAIDISGEKPLIDVQNLSGQVLPKQASFQLKRGEIFGIAGLIGSGRTEMARLLLGLDRQVNGQIKLNHHEISRRSSVRSRLQRGLGLLSEDRAGEGLALARSVEANIHYPVYRQFSRFGFISRQMTTRNAIDWIRRLGIKCHSPNQPVQRLSGGNQQKVALARLFGQNTDVLILDEPTRGVDVGAKVEIYRLIREQAAAGKAILLISSYLPELFGLCDRLAVMHGGKLSEARDIRQWSEESVMQLATQSA